MLRVAKTLACISAAATTIALTSAFAPTPADAAIAAASSHNSSDHKGSSGRCGYHQTCYYYDANESGAVYKTYLCEVDDMRTVKFSSTGSGAGKVVGNNANSAENQTEFTAYTYVGQNLTGAYDYQVSKSYGQLYIAWNNNGSFFENC